MPSPLPLSLARGPRDHDVVSSRTRAVSRRGPCWAGALAPACAPAPGWAEIRPPGPQELKSFFFFFSIFFPFSYLYLDIFCTKNYPNTF
jgi:hypothetical protein